MADTKEIKTRISNFLRQFVLLYVFINIDIMDITNVVVMRSNKYSTEYEFDLFSTSIVTIKPTISINYFRQQ